MARMTQRKREREREIQKVEQKVTAPIGKLRILVLAAFKVKQEKPLRLKKWLEWFQQTMAALYQQKWLEVKPLSTDAA